MNPRNITERNVSLNIFNIPFCSIWKSNGTTLNQAIGKLRLIFKVFDNVKSDEHVKILVKCEKDPKKSPLINMKFYDLETYNKDKVVLF